MSVDTAMRATLLAAAVATATAWTAAAQRAGDVDPFVIAGALRLEVEIETCGLSVSAQDRSELRQAIVRLQKRAGLPDAMIAKVQKDMLALKDDPDWKPMQAEACKDMRTNFKKYLTEVLGKSQ
jgi:hypothetical protein